MAGFHGMDIDAVRNLAAQLDSKAGEIDQIANVLTSTLNGAHWEGPDATRYRGDWTGTHHPQLTAVANALREASTAAKNNVMQQENASNA
jgi:uncharacterized protein YukE